MAARSVVFWFTGLSGAGKSTLANRLRDALVADGKRILILDGDDVRNRLHRHLGFSPEDIRLNNKLIVDLCVENRTVYDAILVPVISPYLDSRAAARRRLEPGFYEIFVRASLCVLHDRDTKGLYRAAQFNEIDNLIGVSPSSPYDTPQEPDLVIDTSDELPERSAARLLEFANRFFVERGTK